MRSVAAGISAKSGSTMTAEALVVVAWEMYLGLETKVTSPGCAVSMAATPWIWTLGSPCNSAPRCAASSAKVIWGF